MGNIIRWDDPFAGLTSLHSQLDDMFSNLFVGLPSAGSGQNALPRMNVYTEKDRLVVDVEVPGYKKDEVEISVHNGILEIKGEKNEQEEDKKKSDRSYMVREMHQNFYRSMRLPEYANEDQVTAHFGDNGLLKITVPYRELPQPKKVAITAGKSKK